MDEDLIADFLNLRERALTLIREFLSQNPFYLTIPESKIGEVSQVAYNTIINKDRIYADFEKPEWEIKVNNLSFDEIYHILNFLENLKLKEVNNER